LENGEAVVGVFGGFVTTILPNIRFDLSPANALNKVMLRSKD
jgi:hypothetical protein